LVIENAGLFSAGGIVGVCNSGRYRITGPIIALFMEERRHLACHVPEGTVITFNPNTLQRGKLINVTWDQKTVMMFARDLRASAVAID
jgi:hypothetical protein